MRKAIKIMKEAAKELKGVEFARAYSMPERVNELLDIIQECRNVLYDQRLLRMLNYARIMSHPGQMEEYEEYLKKIDKLKITLDKDMK